MIFQDPTSALNPVFRIGQLFSEVLRAGGKSPGRHEAQRIATAALEEVSITIPPSPPIVQLSGDMNQLVFVHGAGQPTNAADRRQAGHVLDVWCRRRPC